MLFTETKKRKNMLAAKATVPLINLQIKIRSAVTKIRNIKVVATKTRSAVAKKKITAKTRVAVKKTNTKREVIVTKTNQRVMQRKNPHRHHRKKKIVNIKVPLPKNTNLKTVTRISTEVTKINKKVIKKNILALKTNTGKG